MILAIHRLKLAVISEVQSIGRITEVAPIILPLVCKIIARPIVNPDAGLNYVFDEWTLTDHLASRFTDAIGFLIANFVAKAKAFVASAFAPRALAFAPIAA